MLRGTRWVSYELAGFGKPDIENPIHARTLHDVIMSTPRGPIQRGQKTKSQTKTMINAVS
eukprot:5454768-Amphidinium_carterae.1